jgi:hypothetical protein
LFAKNITYTDLEVKIMELKWASLTEEQVNFLKRVETEFAEKFGEKVYVIALNKE